MADWPLGLGQQKHSLEGEVSAGTTGTLINSASGSANTKGSWTELSASLPFNANGFWLDMPDLSAAAFRSFLLDIGIGAAASEVVVVPNILLNPKATPWVTGPLWFPIRLPVGARLAARIQCDSATQSGARILVRPASQSWVTPESFGRATDYGVNTSTSLGVTVDPGGSVDTYGSWTELIASTTYRIRALSVFLSSLSNGTMTNALWRFDIGVGAAASEVVFLEGIQLVGNTAEVLCPQWVGPFGLDLPAGSRLAMRARCSINDATDRLIAAGLVGFD